jgi:hypothetical protein
MFVCAGFSALPFAGFAGAAGGGVPLCAELLALFKAPEEAAAAECNTGAGKGRPEQPGSPEVNNSTGEGCRLQGPVQCGGQHTLPLPHNQAGWCPSFTRHRQQLLVPGQGCLHCRHD